MEQNIDNRPVMVSIQCCTYNQAKYIRQCLDGFVMQKTNFRFEAIVHDDASTDGTADIVREYAEMYPDIIKPILETENQYSKHDGSLERIVNEASKGKYIAICEGDDWWISSNKLQLQFDALEKNPNVDMCANGTICYLGGIEKLRMCPSKEDRILSAEETILGGGGFLGTNSLMFRSSMLDKKMFFLQYLGLDYFTQIRGALRGGILYLAENMSAYRLSADNSWCENMKKNHRNYYEHREKVITALNILNFETGYLYDKEISKVKIGIIRNQLDSGFKSGIYVHGLNFKMRVRLVIMLLLNLFK